MSLQLTFSGASGPYKWSIILETVCDLTTAIKHNEVPPPKYLDDLIPFAKGLELIVEIEINPRGTTNDYIDNLISLTVDVEGTDNIVRCDRAPLLAFDTCSRPLHENEPNPQETMEAINKLESEALREEQKVILGWLINFRRLLIRLPKNKFMVWPEAIRK